MPNNVDSLAQWQNAINMLHFVMAIETVTLLAIQHRPFVSASLWQLWHHPPVSLSVRQQGFQQLVLELSCHGYWHCI